MEKIFFDTNVVLDILLDRENAPYARRILEYCRKDDYTRVYISYLTVANAAYILRKRPVEDTRKALKAMMKCMNVVSSGDIQILHAIKCEGPDFEDSLQIASAESRDCDVIITRNPDHFRDFTEIPVLSPLDFVSHCK